MSNQQDYDSDSLNAVLSRIEIKLDQTIMIQAQVLAEQNKHTERLSKLENWKWWISGVSVGVGFILAKFAEHIIK